MIDLGTLGGNYSNPYGINNLRQIVRYSYTPSFQMHAFLWTQGGGMIDSGTLGGNYSNAYGINNLGQIVGESCLAGNSASHSFSWTARRCMIGVGPIGGKI